MIYTIDLTDNSHKLIIWRQNHAETPSEAHLESHSRLYLRLLTDCQTTLQPPIEDTPQTYEDLSTPTTKGITHCAARLGYTTNLQRLCAMHVEKPQENKDHIHVNFNGTLPVNVSCEVI